MGSSRLAAYSFWYGFYGNILRIKLFNLKINDMKNRDKILLGILGAAAAGVAVGLLFYTEEGKKTRKKMKNTANDWADSFGSLVASGKENLSHFSDKALKQAKQGFKKAKNKAEDAYAEVADNLQSKFS